MSERWKPEQGELYYFITTAGDVIPDRFSRFEISSNARFCFNNYFKTEAEARAAAEKVKALLLSLHDEQPVTDCNQLPDWCKVGSWVWLDPKKIFGSAGYKKIKFTEGLGLNFENGSCIYFSDKIKQARLRPYNAEELRGLVGKVVEEKCSSCVAIITSCFPESKQAGICGKMFTVDELLDMFTIYGQLCSCPCGVLEHLENGEWVK